MWPSIRATPLANGYFLYFGRQLMAIYPGSEHVRSAEFRVPALSGTDPNGPEGQDVPVVNATVYTIANNAGTIFGIYEIVQNLIGNETQIVIGATNTDTGQKVDDDFYCSVTIIGKPVSSQGNPEA